MTTANDVMGAIDHRGLSPHEIAAILNICLFDQLEDVPRTTLEMPPIDKIQHLIELGVPADRLIRQVYDYGTP